ncbi:MAG: elongation factor G [bacterium]
MAIEVGQIRNIGIVGQGGSGKTSLADAILFTAGATTRLGSVDDGTSSFDFEPEETRRKLSLTTAFHHAPWKKHELTVVDTPGYINFLTDGLNCMRACTAAVLVLEPHSGGVKVEAERVWSRADQLALPVVAFVTKMDRENADFDGAVKDLSDQLQAKAVPVQLPIGSAETFRGVVDLLTMKALIAQPNGQMKEEAIPAELADAAKAARERLMETAAETDDALVEQYLERGELTTEQLLPALRGAVHEARFVPVLCGAGGKGLGIAPLLDFVVDFTPSPGERGLAGGEDPKSGEPIEREMQPSAPFSAVVIKNIVDQFSGKLSVFQVVSGDVSSDTAVLNVTKDAKERLGHLLRLEGKKQAQVEKLTTGEIGAVAKLKETEAGDTLADEKAPIRYPGLVPASVAISFAIEPKAKGDEDKIVQGLHKLMEEDPTLTMQRDAQTKEIILSGVGQLHIEVAVEKLKRKFNVEVELKAPKVPYKETIKGTAKAQGRLKKQTGGRGQFGDCWLEVSPLPRGAGFEFVDAVVGGAVPRQFIPAVEKGVREALHEGILAHNEIIDVRVKLYDGSFHTVDSSEMAFKIAASMGFKAAMQQARPILLEPVMAMEIAVPDDCIGDVIGDLNSRRGKVLGVDPRIGTQVIRALAPMAEVLRYSPDLRSMTSGRGAFTMRFDHYDELPAHLVDNVVKEAEERRAQQH